MDEKIKVYNHNRFFVGIKLLNGLQIAIAPGSFTKLSRDDIEYVASVSSYFKRGILRVDEKAVEVKNDIYISPEHEVNFIPDSEVKKKLGSTASALRKWLEPINDEVMLDRIYTIAKEMDLASSKIKVLQEKFGDKEF